MSIRVEEEFIIIIITLFLLQLPYKRVSFLLVMVLYFDRNKNIIDLDLNCLLNIKFFIEMGEIKVYNYCIKKAEIKTDGS